ncbi:Ribosomal protein L31e [Kalmanozyma brasiliensis GHG001]|uniref:60S ribosomal protein L31 n=2 Tax=Ustilaginaceae TaxID=5268 RepID=V5F0J0_KALBG|nr:ribosomal 60S subunit protein L31 [Ustilago maydis 521]XP_016294812.1 Ribosomal protein L31e [Kalmanozyma brasiliensis GHG001]EST09823.1 Ribosomal protein L31e [Kalmanozyma brasiliensis GHG001]KIS71763.1 ribosomal 60S subunit protein L31 [Ustilago maydis 521]|eukprot:XP_011386640.1 ribosomal 60S subunit protein L31 [Ustilago maydis 521]
MADHKDKSQKGKKTRSALNDVVTREYTVNLHKRVHDVAFKKRAPRAIKEVVAFAQKAMGTKDVRLDPKLNQEVWKYGVKNFPRRLRVRLERKRNDDEGAKEKLYTYAVPVLGLGTAKGLQTTVIDQE